MHHRLYLKALEKKAHFAMRNLRKAQSLSVLHSSEVAQQTTDGLFCGVQVAIVTTGAKMQAVLSRKRCWATHHPEHVCHRIRWRVLRSLSGFGKSFTSMRKYDLESRSFD
jgi:hypothetical protein